LLVKLNKFTGELYILKKITFKKGKNIMEKKIILEALNADNWFKICDLSVSDEQKTFFPISNLYWISISRYEEKTELFAIKADAEYVGLVGGGFDEDGITGYINPIK